MITKIGIDGFKTFKDFSLEFEPFHVIIGPNASGKSNLFDALDFFSRLATENVTNALKSKRGAEIEQFTQLPDGKYAEKIIIKAEFLLDKHIEDTYGRKSTLKYTRLRYGLEITRKVDSKGKMGFFITKEQLSRIPKSEDSWYDNHFHKSDLFNYWEPEYIGGQTNLIYKGKLKSNEQVIVLRGEGDQNKPRNFKAANLQKSALSSVTGVEYPHAFAVQQELSRFKFLHLNPDKIRIPSNIYEQSVLSSEGENLASVVNRLFELDKFLLKDISRDLSNLVPGVVDVFVVKDEKRQLYEVKIKNEDGRTFPLSLASEGTLRLLALITLKHDLGYPQTIFLEEPENGVHLSRLKKLLELLASMVTNLHSQYAPDFPLRQIIINTHSIDLIRYLRENHSIFENQLPGVSISEMFTHIDPEKNWKIKFSKMESLPIAYGADPIYKQEPYHLYSKLERLLHVNDSVNSI